MRGNTSTVTNDKTTPTVSKNETISRNPKTLGKPNNDEIQNRNCKLTSFLFQIPSFLFQIICPIPLLNAEIGSKATIADEPVSRHNKTLGKRDRGEIRNRNWKVPRFKFQIPSFIFQIPSLKCPISLPNAGSDKNKRKHKKTL